MYNSARKTAILDVLIIICCVIDSEIRWKDRVVFDEFDFNPYTHYSFYLLNVLRCISMVSACFCVKFTLTWYQADIKKLKQRNKIS